MMGVSCDRDSILLIAHEAVMVNRKLVTLNCIVLSSVYKCPTCQINLITGFHTSVQLALHAVIHLHCCDLVLNPHDFDVESS